MTFRVPTPGWNNFILGESMIDWLQRTDPDQHWVLDELTNEPKAPSDPDLESPYVWTIRPTISSSQFQAITHEQLFVTPMPVVSPVWPGLANVVLGDSQALSDGLVLTGNIRGLLFTIIRDAPGGGRWKFGDLSSWNNVGAVTFQTDNGEWERPITISVDTQIVVPTTMVIASSAVIRLTSPFSGTVTPWSLPSD
jgi:hypothetical protein